VTAAVTFQFGTMIPQGMSHLSLDYVQVPVTASQAGTSYNPTADTVQFAFMPQATQAPQNADWVAASWDTAPTNILFPYTAKCLVGTGGATALTLGTYYTYVKIQDSPEVPVNVVGHLQIT